MAGLLDNGAAFGFFPQLKRRTVNTNTTSLPIDVLRGRLAGLLGAPSDILNLLQSPQPMEVFGDVNYQKTPELPYGTEHWLKELPLAPTSPAGNVLGKAASFVPLNPAPAIRGVQKVGQMAGEELAATMLGQRPNTLLDKVIPKPAFMVPPEQGLLAPKAPVSDIGFVSALEQTGLNLRRNTGSGQSFLNDLMKGENVKADEIRWIGLDEYLKNKPNVTKQEVQDFIANNKVDVKEVTLGTNPTRWEGNTLIVDNNPVGEIRDTSSGYAWKTPDGQYQLLGANRMFDAVEKVQQKLGVTVPEQQSPKFGQYTLPGGENYREILLTMPSRRPSIKNMSRAEYNAAIDAADKAGIQDYRSSHWDEPNILAHIRVNDRVDADGKKMLLIEEVQSDWHQAGREKGYKSDVNPEENKALVKQWDALANERKDLESIVSTGDDADPAVQSAVQRLNEISNELNAVNDRLTQVRTTAREGVPDAPFKDTWYQLALKRAMKYAADNGYDRVGLTTGARQAERYDLSKQVDELLYKQNPDGTFQLSAQAGGRGNMIGEAIPKEKLADYVGKDVAKSIVDGSGKDINLGGSGSYSQPKDMWKSMSGIDLQVGGEGMKKYYDEIYPKFLDKYGKKWGAKVGETTINLQKDLEGFMPRKNMQIESVRYIDITPEMRTSTSKGQPLFSAAPLLPTTGLLADEEKRKELKSLLEY